MFNFLCSRVWGCFFVVKVLFFFSFLVSFRVKLGYLCLFFVLFSFSFCGGLCLKFFGNEIFVILPPYV